MEYKAQNVLRLAASNVATALYLLLKCTSTVQKFEHYRNNKSVLKIFVHVGTPHSETRPPHI